MLFVYVHVYMYKVARLLSLQNYLARYIGPTTAHITFHGSLQGEDRAWL